MTKRRRGSSWLAALLLLIALPGSVLGTAYSLRVYQATWTPPGQSTPRTVCVQAGMVDVARNYGQIIIFSNSVHSCNAPNYAVPSGYIGTHLTGWRDGSYCGATGTYYSNVSTSAWQLWSYICSNPAGVQAFYTYAYGVYWNGNGYTATANVRSPNQNY